MQDIETGVEYAVVVSTCAGLWGYIVGDTVRFIDRSPPRIMITGRTSYVLSAVGEHVIAEEIDDAIRSAAIAIGLSVVEYTVSCLLPVRPGQAPRHCYIVEFSSGCSTGAQAAEFGYCVDGQLQKRNDDYASHRRHNFSLDKPEIIAVRGGTFANWMKKRGKMGGQNKVPRIINDPALWADLMTFCQSSAINC